MKPKGRHVLRFMNFGVDFGQYRPGRPFRKCNLARKLSDVYTYARELATTPALSHQPPRGADTMQRSIKQSITILALLTVLGCGSMARMSPEMREVSAVEDHELSKDEAFDKTMRWIAESYNSANTVVQLSDEEGGTVVIQATETVRRLTVTIPVRYRMTIDVKDNRIRFQQVILGRDGGGGLVQSDAEEMHQVFADVRASLLLYFQQDMEF